MLDPFHEPKGSSLQKPLRPRIAPPTLQPGLQCHTQMTPELAKLFLCHANEEKVPFVRDLAEALFPFYRVWYDEYSLPPGASIFQSVSAGLAACDFGVVVLSKPFFAKKWTQAELGGLFARESPTLRRIIPVWKDVNFEEVRDFSPILADRRAVNASDGVPAVVSFMSQAVKTAGQQDGFVHTGTVATRFSALSNRLASVQTSRTLSESAEGANLVSRAQDGLFDLMQQQAKRLAAEAPQLRITHKRSGELQCFPNNILQLTVEAHGGIELILEATRPASGSISRARCALDIFRINRDRFAGEAEPANLESHSFTPDLSGQGDVQWQDSRGTRYDPQQLSDFAFQRFYESIERWHQQAIAR